MSGWWEYILSIPGQSLQGLFYPRNMVFENVYHLVGGSFVVRLLMVSLLYEQI